MNSDLRKAFVEVRSDGTRAPQDAWTSTSAVHVNLRSGATQALLGGVAEAATGTGSNPPGAVLQGPHGSGKSHLLGTIREEAHRKSGYFFLVDRPSEADFWEDAAGSIRNDLRRDVLGEGSQLATFLGRLCDLVGVTGDARDSVVGDSELGPTNLKDFVVAFLRGVERGISRECQDTLRALVLYNSPDPVTSEVGETYLRSMAEQRPYERSERGMRSTMKPPPHIVNEVFRLLSLTGPIVVAIDHIDDLVAEPARSKTQLGHVMDRLLTLRDTGVRTFVVVSCLPTTWAALQDATNASVADRFVALKTLEPIRDAIPAPMASTEQTASAPAVPVVAKPVASSIIKIEPPITPVTAPTVPAALAVPAVEANSTIEVGPAVKVAPAAGTPIGTVPGKPARPARPSTPPLVARPSRITIGADTVSRQPMTLPLEILRRHTAIFAGSGSGKTVLIRRLVEECALRGVSSIVLDPNNDLARLGDPWPKPPTGWGPGDARLAKEYLDQTDVVVWTPRIIAGRPLTFQPLPDFHSVRDNPDELELALDAALITLAGKAGVSGSTGKARQAQAVLREALTYFARGNRTTLTSFVDLLGDLPDGVTRLDPAGKIAIGLATALQSEMTLDPLFGGKGAAADPDALLTPAGGKRARVSVISFVGLPGNEQRQNFVNQLQLALFAWAKKNPAGDRPLGGLFVMDEAQTFAPSGALTACTKTTLMLASQVRKYGLGLVFATQAPKGLHNQISGNATTQFFGLLSSPVHIEAAKEMARAKGGDASQIGRLKTGQFYAASEGVRFRKIQSPLCLSYHPKSPLTEDEVVERARRGSS